LEFVIQFFGEENNDMLIIGILVCSLIIISGIFDSVDFSSILILVHVKSFSVCRFLTYLFHTFYYFTYYFI